jgi:hypothetical protein
MNANKSDQEAEKTAPKRGLDNARAVTSQMEIEIIEAKKELKWSESQERKVADLKNESREIEDRHRKEIQEIKDGHRKENKEMPR